MIDETLQEQAALHALGMLRGEERHAFEKRCAANDELRTLVESLRHTADGLAHALPPVAPPPALRDMILRDASGSRQEQQTAPEKIVAFPPAARRSSALKLAIAALVALIPAGLAVHYFLEAGAERSARESAERNAAVLADERGALQIEKDTLTKSLGAANTSYEEAQRTITELRALSTKQAGELTALTGLKNQLDEEVKNLKARQLFDEAQIALLSPPPASKAPKAIAVSVWNQKKQDGVFVVQNLPALKPDRNYQLWVLDGEVPVSAGLLTLDASGNGRIEFKARKQIAAPSLFAVTNEVKGEHESPDLKNLVLAGK
jgi:anti-sigma-K factor RskA